MKYICSLCASFMLAICIAPGQAAIQGPINFKFHGTWQTTSDKITTTTRATVGATNIVAKSQYITSDFVIDNSTLLEMLKDAFETNHMAVILPPDAFLRVNNDSNIVIASGTNVILDVSPVMTLNPDPDSVLSGSLPVNMNNGQNQAQSVNRYQQTFTTTINYDDTPFITAYRTTGTQFSVKGIETQHIESTGNGSNENVSIVFDFTGFGGGSVNQNGFQRSIILRGSFLGTASGPEIIP